MDPLVSVVIPTYNRGYVIGEALESVMAQTYPRLEVIVVDDGSTDDTAEVVARFGERVRYVRQDNQGLAGARNTGLAHSSGEYVAWFDSDDLCAPGKLALQVAYLQRRPDCILTATDFSAFGEGVTFERSHIASYYSVLRRTPGGLAGVFSDQETLETAGLPFMAPDIPRAVTVYSGILYPQLVHGNCLHPPTVVFRRDAALRAGGLEPRFHKDVDWEFFLRMSRQGRMALIDHPLLRYRISDDQMSSEKYLAEIEMSGVLVLDSVKANDPELFTRRAFRRRMGSCHLAVAHALAEVNRRQAAHHLARSLAWGYADLDTARTFAKLCLPAWAVARLRKRPVAEPGPGSA
jgi:glycosyltransferase involved in cell wall biosynthesis